MAGPSAPPLSLALGGSGLVLPLLAFQVSRCLASAAPLRGSSWPGQCKGGWSHKAVSRFPLPRVSPRLPCWLVSFLLNLFLSACSGPAERWLEEEEEGEEGGLPCPHKCKLRPSPNRFPAAATTRGSRRRRRSRSRLDAPLPPHHRSHATPLCWQILLTVSSLLVPLKRLRLSIEPS